MTFPSFSWRLLSARLIRRFRGRNFKSAHLGATAIEEINDHHGDHYGKQKHRQKRRDPNQFAGKSEVIVHLTDSPLLSVRKIVSVTERGRHPERSEGSVMECLSHVALAVRADPSEYLRMTVSY
jgi:hypothetical protein